MKEEQKTEIKVGITVLIALIIFIWILGWAKNISINSEKKELKIMFDSVAGLEKGDVVTVNGVRQGFVDEITNKGNSVFVRAKLNPSVDLKSDATFSVVMLDLMGGKKIEINPGVSQMELDYSVTHEGKFLGDVASAFIMLSSIQTDIVDMIKEIKVTLKNTNQLLGDEEFSSSLKSSLNNLNSLTGKMTRLVDDNSEKINKLIASSEKAVSSFNQFYDENKETIQTTLIETKNAISSSSELVNKLNSFLDETKKQNNNAGKLLYDKKFIDDLQTSIEQLKELTKILIEQLKGKGINVDANIDLF